MNRAFYEYNIQILEETLNLIDDDLKVISYKLNEIQVKKIAIHSIVKCLKTALVDIVENKQEAEGYLCGITLTPMEVKDKE